MPTPRCCRRVGCFDKWCQTLAWQVHSTSTTQQDGARASATHARTHFGEQEEGAVWRGVEGSWACYGVRGVAGTEPTHLFLLLCAFLQACVLVKLGCVPTRVCLLARTKMLN